MKQNNLNGDKKMVKQKMTKKEMEVLNPEMKNGFACLKNGDQYLWNNIYEIWCMWKKGL